MDKTSKRVLKYLCKHNLYNNYAFFFVNGLCLEFANNLNILEDELRQCISYLHKEEYIDYAFTGSQITGFILTHKGLHYKEINFFETTKAIIKYIIVPVAITLISAIALHELGLK